MMKTLVTGCSGLVGSALVEALFRQGHTVQCLQREKKSGGENFWATRAIPEQERFFDQVVHLAGESQMADEMVLSSTRAIPRVLLAAGYAFQDTSLDAVLQECVKPS
jgi:NAD dependent epimerase/dehydratase family enzyme